MGRRPTSADVLLAPLLTLLTHATSAGATAPLGIISPDHSGGGGTSATAGFTAAEHVQSVIVYTVPPVYATAADQPADPTLLRWRQRWHHRLPVRPSERVTLLRRVNPLLLDDSLYLALTADTDDGTSRLSILDAATTLSSRIAECDIPPAGPPASDPLGCRSLAQAARGSSLVVYVCCTGSEHLHVYRVGAGGRVAYVRPHPLPGRCTAVAAAGAVLAVGTTAGASVFDLTDDPFHPHACGEPHEERGVNFVHVTPRGRVAVATDRGATTLVASSATASQYVHDCPPVVHPTATAAAHDHWLLLERADTVSLVDLSAPCDTLVATPWLAPQGGVFALQLTDAYCYVLSRDGRVRAHPPPSSHALPTTPATPTTAVTTTPGPSPPSLAPDTLAHHTPLPGVAAAPTQPPSPQQDARMQQDLLELTQIAALGSAVGAVLGAAGASSSWAMRLLLVLDECQATTAAAAAAAAAADPSDDASAAAVATVTAGLSYPRALHPTQWTLQGHPAAGMVVGNLLLGAGIFAVSSAASSAAVRSGRWTDAQARLRHPSLPLFALHFLHPGVALGAAVLVFAGASSGLTTLGAAALAACVAYPVWLLRVVARGVPHAACFMRDEDGVGSSSVRLVVDVRRARVRRLLCGSGEWVSRAESLQWARRYDTVVGPYHPRCPVFLTVELLVGTALACVQGAAASTSAGCGTKKAATGAVLLLTLGLGLVVRPHGRQRDAVTEVLALLSQAAATFFLAWGHYSEGPSYVLFDAAASCLSGTVTLLLLRVGLDVVAEVIVRLSGRRSGLQKAAYRLQPADSTRHSDHASSVEGSGRGYVTHATILIDSEACFFPPRAQTSPVRSTACCSLDGDSELPTASASASMVDHPLLFSTTTEHLAPMVAHGSLAGTMLLPRRYSKARTPPRLHSSQSQDIDKLEDTVGSVGGRSVGRSTPGRSGGSPLGKTDSEPACRTPGSPGSLSVPGSPSLKHLRATPRSRRKCPTKGLAEAGDDVFVGYEPVTPTPTSTSHSSNLHFI